MIEDCARAGGVAGGAFKFTVTSPYMLARTLLDTHYGDFEFLTMAIADVLADQVQGLPCSCLQVDEANVPAARNTARLPPRPSTASLMPSRVRPGFIFALATMGADHSGRKWKPLIEFLNALHADHLVLELAHRPKDDLEALKEIRPEIGIGLGVVDIKVNHAETPEEIAHAIEEAESALGAGRVKFVHPDCGFWMLKRSIADRKIANLAKGRDLYSDEICSRPVLRCLRFHDGVRNG